MLNLSWIAGVNILLATDPNYSERKLQNGMDPEIIDTDICGT